MSFLIWSTEAAETKSVGTEKTTNFSKDSKSYYTLQTSLSLQTLGWKYIQLVAESLYSKLLWVKEHDFAWSI